MPNAVPKKPWTHISVDFIMKLLLAQGYDSILVVCDRMTKMVYFVPTTERTLAERVARLFQDNIWKLHGLPKSIIMDRRGTVCDRNDEGVEPYAGNKYKTVNGLSPIDR